MTCQHEVNLDATTYPDLIRVTCRCGLDYFAPKRGSR